MNRIKRIQIGNRVMYTKSFDKEDLRQITLLIQALALNQMITAKMFFSDLVERMQTKAAIRDFLDGINDSN
ncbi:MAG: hypothetical protein SOX53_03755 [Candidatus Onthovivens sp.]|nr:hypothetical protein [Candidatus Onthovivens sp.]